MLDVLDPGKIPEKKQINPLSLRTCILEESSRSSSDIGRGSGREEWPSHLHLMNYGPSVTL